jgi:hypothetical protein
MANGTLQEVMQKVAVLSFDEKLTLAAFLIEQAKKDAAAETVNDAQINGREKGANDQSLSPRDKPDPLRRREYEWLRQHREEYAGQYVALFDDQLISHGPNLREVIKTAREAGYPRALMVRIEAPDELPFGGW